MSGAFNEPHSYRLPLIGTTLSRKIDCLLCIATHCSVGMSNTMSTACSANHTMLTTWALLSPQIPGIVGIVGFAEGSQIYTTCTNHRVRGGHCEAQRWVSSKEKSNLLSPCFRATLKGISLLELLMIDPALWVQVHFWPYGMEAFNVNSNYAGPPNPIFVRGQCWVKVSLISWCHCKVQPHNKTILRKPKQQTYCLQNSDLFESLRLKVFDPELHLHNTRHIVSLVIQCLCRTQPIKLVNNLKLSCKLN